MCFRIFSNYSNRWNQLESHSREPLTPIIDSLLIRLGHVLRYLHRVKMYLRWLGFTLALLECLT